MTDSENLTIQLQSVTYEQIELHGILENYINKDLNNRLNSLEMLKKEHKQVMSDLQKLPIEISEALNKCKQLIEENESYVFLNSLVLQDLTPLKKDTHVLRLENKKLLEEQIGLQESCEEVKKLFRRSLRSSDPELLSVIRQKEKDLVLAARLGKALLERNQDMSRQYEQMHKELTDKLEHLEQEKHELRRRFENREGEWEGRVSELETDVKQLQDELERQQVHLREADREKTRAVQELSEQNQRLLDQLSRASEVERQLSMQVHALREDFREKNSSTNQHIIRLESLQAESQFYLGKLFGAPGHGGVLGSSLNFFPEIFEGMELSSSRGRSWALLAEIWIRCLAFPLFPQLHQSQLELQEVRLSYRQLQVKVEELTEERSLQSSAATSTSLLSEIEQSMEAEELEQEREQLRLQLWEAYCQVRYLCSHLRGNDSADSAVSTDSSMDESSETSSAKDVPAGSLRTALNDLKRLIQSIVDGVEPTGARRMDDDSLEEQIRQTSEDSRALRELMEGERGKLRQSLEELQQLHSQVTLLSVEMTALKEERDRLRVTSEDKEPKEQLQKAIRDRDEAIAKKNAVELELAKCKMDMMSLNSQLLDAIQQKLNLSQQLEAWQDDMHRVIDRQLMDTHLKEQSRPAAAFSRGHGVGRGQEPSTMDGKRLFSFFRKI
ncbi:bicaudal D-related protein 1 [Cricetulus griseus]|uniref:Bicaudal D-related protein 1 n=2 Tax=Cricetulus griseus TaxID=10029 RepID=A0A061I0F8_CRIGR|nr:bicaudal D-related protein 1 [Cricetulus griseus]